MSAIEYFNGGKNWTLTFSSSVDSVNYANNSLPDGAYSLNVTVGSINQTFTFFVFFGDFNGDGAVNAADWLLFAPYFNTSVRSNNWFMDGNDDGNDDGDINGADYLLFKGTKGVRFPLSALSFTLPSCLANFELSPRAAYIT